MVVNNDTLTVLGSRAYSYLLFQSLLGSEPTKELLETASSDTTLAALDIYAVDDLSLYSSALSSAKLVLGAAKSCPGKSPERLRNEYTRLYVGPLELQAPPWESIYVSKRKQLFDENTLNVRNFYRSQGFLPAEYPKVADDHIALECAFIAQLGDRACRAFFNDEAGVAKASLDASQLFLKEHLLLWLPNYVRDLDEIEGAEFYPIMARLALEYAKVDSNFISELLSEI